MFALQNSAPSWPPNPDGYRKRTPTAEDIKNLLKKKEKELAWENGLRLALKEDVKKAADKVKAVLAEIAKLRGDNKGHQARGMETKQLRDWQQKERDANGILKKQPEKIQLLEQAVEKLKEDLWKANEAEKERRAAYEASKAATQASQPVNTLSASSGAVAGAKRKATDESQQEPKRPRTDGSAPPASASNHSTPPRKDNSATNRRMRTGRDFLRPQQSRATKSEAAPPASQQPNKPTVKPSTSKAAGEATAGTISSTPSSTAHGQGKKTKTAPTQPSSSKKVTGDQPVSQKPNIKPNTSKRAGDMGPPGTGSNSGISKPSRSTAGAANGSTAAAGKKRKEMSKSTSGSRPVKDARASQNKSARENAAGSRRVTRSTHREEQSKEDTAPTKNKKRRASDDNNDDRASKKQKTGGQDPQPTRLSNWSQGCFSNVVIQLLDAGLGGHDIDTLLGEVKESEPFSSTTGRKLIESIKAATVAGETEKVSAVKHLRELLAMMHAEYSTQTGKTVNSKVFQLAVAYGVAEDAIRNAMDGSIQQDAFEYYQLLLNILLEDPCLVNEEALRAQFEIETETQDKCKACDHESDPRLAINNYHGIDIPEEADLDDWDKINDLFAKSLYSPKEGECDECKETKLQSQTSFTKLPENIVIKLNRTRFANNMATKIETIVPYAQAIFPYTKTDKPKRYELSAVVMYEGDTIQEGHYTIYRKQGDKWFLLDDREEESIPVRYEQMADSVKDVDAKRPAIMSAMMLYKKAPVQN